ncbi:MAG TPA: MauE/DoxX family redox-associated membrane protein [Candidatus Limnocylindrales bacterium]
MGEWTINVLVALAAATLLHAGIYKAVRPAELRQALRELAPDLAIGIGNSAVRFAAGLEILIAFLWLVPTGPHLAPTGAALLGLCFAALGVAGRVRASTAACGCLGFGTGKALGLTNVVFGACLVAVALLSFAGSVTPSPTVTALFLLLLCIFANRAAAYRLPARKGVA